MFGVGAKIIRTWFFYNLLPYPFLLFIAGSRVAAECGQYDKP